MSMVIRSLYLIKRGPDLLPYVYVYVFAKAARVVVEYSFGIAEAL